ncbi:MAG: RraA family protein [Gammaproteobacteria bacterium]|nr:RraA family protein [Gammaproteobacteria bacterium]
MTDALTDRLQKLYSGAVHDVMRSMGHDNCVLPESLRPLDPGLKVAGRIWTVSGRIDRTQSAHDTLVGWTTVLSKAPADTVVVCQPNNHEVALMGELSAETLQAKGVRGYVVDGGCRDTDFILELGFPVFHTFFTPSDIVARWIPDHFEAPVTIGTVTVCTGDYLLGDRDGLVVLPGALAEEIVTKTEAVATTENQVRDAIRGGMDPVDAYLKFGKF